MLSQEDFLNHLKDLNEYSDKLIGGLEQTSQDVHRWLKCLLSESEAPEKNDTIKFPKTPLATRRTRKRPNVETITEDDEVVQFEARGYSNASDVSLMNATTTSTRSTRSSRTASRNAHMKISAQSKQTLNQKLRRPTRSKPGISFLQPLPPPAKTRGAGRRNTIESPNDGSFASARGSVCVDEPDLDESILIVEQPKRTRANERAKLSVRKVSAVTVEQQVAVANLSPLPEKVVTSQSMQSPDMFTDGEVDSEKDRTSPEAGAKCAQATGGVVLTCPKTTVAPSAETVVAAPKPVPAPRIMSPLVTAPQCKSPQVFNPYKVESVKKRVMAYEMLGTVSEEVSPARVPTVAVTVTENVPMRVTRTKTRALARQTKDVADGLRKEQSTVQKLARTSLRKAKRISLAKEQRLQEEHRLNSSGKENSILGSDARHYIMPPYLHTSSGKSKPTPLANSKPVRLNVLTSANRIHTHNTSAKNLENKSSNNIVANFDTFITKPVKPNVDDIEEKKREERRRRDEKAEVAQRKRKELMELKREEQRKKREDKQIKALQVREALEREKLEQKQRMEREKEEKARQLAEREEKQREELARRKQQAQQKAHEFEERRKQEEAQRLARIREEEEEKRRVELQRKRDEAEAERQYLRRLAQEKEAAVAAAKQQVAAAKKKAVEPTPLNGTFTLANKKVERPPLKDESDTNYFVPDVSEGESSDDEDHPPRKHPAWADHSLLRSQYKLQEMIPLKAWNCMFSSHAHTPDLALIFNDKKLRNLKRTSSAVWRTPPRFSRMPKP